MRFLDELRGGRKLLRFPRRKHQQCIAVLALQCSKSNQRQRLFRGNHTPRHDDWRAPAAFDLGFKPI